MKVSLIALVAGCTIASAAFAALDIFPVLPPHAAVLDSPSSLPANAAVLDIPPSMPPHIRILG